MPTFYLPQQNECQVDGDGLLQLSADTVHLHSTDSWRCRHLWRDDATGRLRVQQTAEMWSEVKVGCYGRCTVELHSISVSHQSNKQRHYRTPAMTIIHLQEDNKQTQTNTHIHTHKVFCHCCCIDRKGCCVLFFRSPRSEGWPLHGRTFSIYLCPLSFRLTLPQGVLSMYWCCPSRSYVVFLACVYLALFLALSLSPGDSFVSWWCDHSMLASLLWQCLTVSSFSSFVKNPLICFLLRFMKPAESFSALSSQTHQDMFLHSFWVSSFHSSTLQATLAISLLIPYGHQAYKTVQHSSVMALCHKH